MATSLPSTRNVTRVFRAATPAQIESGLDWYANAHAVAATLARKYGVTTEVATGVIAALSPLNSWGANVNLADRFLANATPEARTSGYLGVGLRKAAAILAGVDPVTALGSDKVTNFHLSILAAGETDDVCVDRHSMDVALNVRQDDGTRPKIKGKRYVAFQNVYRNAAAILSREVGLTLWPAQVQAITWVAWRQQFWAEGAFDGHAVEVAA